jgi:hypothetical protein
MRKLLSLIVLSLCFIVAKAQLIGTKNIPGDYATLAAAITDLNTVGVGAGGVIINLNQIETAPSGGYTIGSAALNATTSSTNTIVINGGGNLITAFAGGTGAGTTTTVPDAVLKVLGTDYLTLNQLNIAENSANTTLLTQMECGILFRQLSTTDISQNILIQNCTINLNSSLNGAYKVGIALNTQSSTQANNANSTTGTAPTAAGGAFSNITIRANTITNCYNGISVIGNSTATYYANNVVIGGNAASDANNISSMGSLVSGTTTTGYGIYTNYANAIVKYNSLTYNNNFNAHYAIFNATCNSIELSYNTVSGTSSTTASGVHGVYNSGAAAVSAKVDYNTINNFTLTTTSQCNLIYNSSSTSGAHTTNNNTVSNITRNNYGNIQAIYSSASGTGTNRQFNNNLVQGITWNALGTTGATANYMLYYLGSQSGEVKNNTVKDINYSSTVNTGAVTIYGLFSTSTATTHSYQENIFSNIKANHIATTNATNVMGMRFDGASGIHNILRNNVNNIGLQASATAGSVDGIYTSGAGTRNIINNFISKVETGTALNTDNAIKGINATAGTNNIFNNTVYLTNYSGASITSTGTNFGVSGIVWVGGTATVDVRNNIVSVNAGAQGTGVTAAIRNVSAGKVGFATTSNNNILYAEPVSTNCYHYAESPFNTGTITKGYNNTTDPNFNTSCGLYKAYIAPAESSTFTENQLTATSGTGFMADTYEPTSSSLAEGGAQVLTSVTVDYNNIARGTTPDIGALEFTGTPSDLAPPSISYTNILNNNLSCPAPILSAIITDNSGVNTTAGTKPRLYYKKSTEANAYVGNTSSDNGWKYVEASNTSSPFTFNVDYSLLNTAAVLNDSIYYFVVAQDLATTPNVANNITLFASCPSSVNLGAAEFPVTGAINGFKIINTLNTAITVGAGGDYPTLTGTGGLFEAINLAGLSANTTATIISTPITETGAVALNQINTTCAGTATLTIKPQNTGTVLTGSFAGALIKLNGADNVTIDGSINNTDSRDLTITNTIAAGSGIWISSLGTGAGATNNTIKNCIINIPNTSATQAAIAISGLSLISQGADNDNITIENNKIINNNYGIYASGTSSVSIGGLDNLNISKNNISTVSGNTLTPVYGVFTANSVSSIITKDTISIETTGTTAPIGINLSAGVTGAIVNKNVITKATTSANGGYGGRGIVVGTNSATSNITIANNMISGVNGSNFTSFGNSSAIGIAIGVTDNTSTLSNTTGGVNIYNNSVNLFGNYIGTSTTVNKITASLYIGSAATNLDIRNNILINSLFNPNAVSKNYAIYSAAPNTAFSNINYNVYDTATTHGVLGFLAADAGDLAALTTAFGQNANSTVIAPVFVSNSDLHLIPASNVTLNNLGTSLATVTDDIDGDVRDVSTPDVGADEFAPPVGIDLTFANTGAFVAPIVKSCYSNAETVTVKIQNGSLTTHDFIVNPATVTVNITGAVTQTLTATINTGTLTTGATLDVNMSATLDMTTIGTYTFNSTVVSTGDINTGNDALTPAVNRTVVALAAGTVSSSPSSYCFTGGIPNLSISAGSGVGNIQWEESNVSATGPWSNVGTNNNSYSPAVAISDTMWYRVTTSCNSNSSISNVVSVRLDNPTIITTTPGSRCGAGVVTLNATTSPSATARWFAASTGGIALATGNNFVTPIISTNTTYYVQAEGGGGSDITARIAATNPGTATNLSTYGMDFTVTKNITLNSIDVFSATGTAVTIRLHSANGASELQNTGSVTVPAGVKSTINLGWAITPGTYRLFIPSMTGNFYRENSGPVYPTPLMVLGNSVGNVNGFVSSLTGTVSTSASWYFMYNWSITASCETSRTAVTATVNTTSGNLAGVAGGAIVSNAGTMPPPGETYYETASCDLINKVVPSGASPVTGNVTSAVKVENGAGIGPRGYAFARRIYTITPATNEATATGTITLYYTQADFNDYNSYLTANSLTDLSMPTTGSNADPNVGNLRVSQFHGSVGTGFGTYTGTEEVLIPTTNWNATTNLWEVTFNVVGFSSFYLSTSSIGLPITLANIKATATGNVNTVNWTTASEQNISKFIVQRSATGNNFVSIGEVATQALNGNSSVALNYNFIDVNPIQGKQQYRLQMIDRDGKTKYSNIVTVRRGATSIEITDVRPNPTNGIVNFNIIGVNNNVNLAVRTLNGQTVITKNNTQSNNLSIDLSKLATGMYLIEAIDVKTQEKAVYKVVKQ